MEGEECPICLEQAQSTGMFQCQHLVCKDCATNLLRHQCMNTCPVCRADPKEEYRFAVQIVTGTKQIFCTDAGHYRILDEGEADIKTGVFNNIIELLPELQSPVVFGVRYIEQSVGYIAHGPPSEGFLDMLKKVPLASESSRAGRHARIELGRVPNLYAELINGYSLPGVEFVRVLQFPIQLVEVQDIVEDEVMSTDDSDLEIEVSDDLELDEADDDAA